jgi:hypothetical protein
VLTNRLARVIDRLRVLEKIGDIEQHPHATEISLLRRRARLAQWAISLCTLCALLVCIVIASLFVDSEIEQDPSNIIALLFVSAMSSLIAGLLFFLREIAVAMGAIKKPLPK